MIVLVNSHIAPYQACITPDALGRLGESLGDAVRVTVVVPEPLRTLAEQVGKRCPGRRVTMITVPDAEATKTPTMLERCWDELAVAKSTCSDLVAGLGGGTATGLAGFVAANRPRRVDLISVPITVLSVVDTAAGGKTNINLATGKNLIGASHEPRTMICGLDLLRELLDTEVVSGLAEVVKCGFASDAGILQLVDPDLGGTLDVTSDTFTGLVGRAVTVRVGVTAEGLTKRTSSDGNISRETLDHGYTTRHAIEAHEGFRLHYGQAISIGMVWITEVNRWLLRLDVTLTTDHSRLLGALGLLVTHDPEAWHGPRRLMNLGKKPHGDDLRLVGLATQGRPVALESLDESEFAGPYAVISRRR